MHACIEVEARPAKKSSGLEGFPAGTCTSCRWVPAESDTAQGNTAVVAVAGTSAEDGDTNTGKSDTNLKREATSTATLQTLPLRMVELVPVGAAPKVGHAQRGRPGTVGRTRSRALISWVLLLRVKRSENSLYQNSGCRRQQKS